MNDAIFSNNDSKIEFYGLTKLLNVLIDKVEKDYYSVDELKEIVDLAIYLDTTIQENKPKAFIKIKEDKNDWR